MAAAAAPRGGFVLGEDGDGLVLLVFAGVGVTPVLAMLRQLAATRSEREVWWLHGARGHSLAAEAHHLVASLPQASEHVLCGAATPAERYSMHAQGGRLDKGHLAVPGIPAGASAYICGPNAFMTEISDARRGLGLAPARIHAGLSGARERASPGITGAAIRAPRQPPGPAGPGPLVTFARSGISTPLSGGQRNMPELAGACGVPARRSCRTGVCHTCVTPLLSGAITHAPDPPEPPADGQVLICCARPGTEIALEMSSSAGGAMSDTPGSNACRSLAGG